MSVKWFVSQIGDLHSSNDVITVFSSLIESNPTSSGLGVLLVAEVEVGPNAFQMVLIGNVLEH